MPLNTIRQFVTGDLTTAATLYTMPSNKVFILQDLFVTFTPGADNILKIYDDTSTGELDPILWIDFDTIGHAAGGGANGGNNMHFHFENGIPFGKGLNYIATTSSVVTIGAFGYLL
tara:strand:+ start:1490 stop:1837 length:348 start_codon:yes stop_codon:yes gene_type:complete